jgi:8-oxo-dGTP diphosphatase
MTSPAPPTNEAAYLAAYRAEAFERPSVTVDVALLTVCGGALHALLVPRAAPPFMGRLALPGGFVGPGEDLDVAAARVLSSKAAIDDCFVEQLYTFGAPKRDPRTRVISVSYFALVPPTQASAGWTRLNVPQAGETPAPVEAVDAEGLPIPLAFDHAAILGVAVARLRGKLNYAPVGYALLPPRFTLRALQTVHETILGHTLNKDSFRRRMLATEALEATGEHERGIGRPAELYRHCPHLTPTL